MTTQLQLINIIINITCCTEALYPKMVLRWSLNDHYLHGFWLQQPRTVGNRASWFHQQQTVGNRAFLWGKDSGSLRSSHHPCYKCLEIYLHIPHTPSWYTHIPFILPYGWRWSQCSKPHTKLSEVIFLQSQSFLCQGFPSSRQHLGI